MLAHNITELLSLKNKVNCHHVFHYSGIFGASVHFGSYFATLVSTPAYLTTLIRPDRVPRKAVSTPGSTLHTNNSNTRLKGKSALYQEQKPDNVTRSKKSPKSFYK